MSHQVNKNSKNTLYVVSTPIGNLEDITLRAIRIFKEVDLILCEDTRVTKKLLSAYEIHKPTLSYHSNSSLNKIDHIIDILKDGKNLALVSDAGTPTISDPGSLLVYKVREALGDDINIVSVPGASALTAALSISGMATSDFIFLGFLPHKKGRLTLFKEIAESERAVVFYESPHRLMKSLEMMREVFHESGQEGREVVVCREITKIYEEVKKGNADELEKFFKANEEKIRGEFVIIVGPKF